MSKEIPNALVHSTNQGKLYVNVSELLQKERVRTLIKRLMDSSIYKQIQGQDGDAPAK